MADTTLKAVYFPEIPQADTLLNGSDTGYINGLNLKPGSVDYSALTQSSIQGENTLYGTDALKNVKPFGGSGVDPDEGRRNTAIGYQTLYSLVYGHDNVAIGYRALYSLNT